MLTIDDFELFFAELNDGEAPYVWQSQLVRDIANGHWPDQLVAPTGAGKSALMEILVFLYALSTTEEPPFPRRFVMTVGRRALVDSQAARGEKMASALALATTGILSTVREVLSRTGSAPIRVTVMRGGIALDNSWLDDPVGCQLIFATPELLGSRILFRGYLASKLSRPRHAGLLAYDTVAVVDESHLNIQLVRTLRRVRELASRSPLCEAIPPLRVVETTATPASAAGSRITIADADNDPRLACRLAANKELELRMVPSWPAPRSGAPRRELLTQVADAACLMRETTEGTVGVILNRVQDAVEVASIIEKRGLTVQVLVGPMRPYDRNRLEREHPHLLTPEGDNHVDVLVATQTVEVGVDLDLHGLVTEVAPGSSLVQRWGRVNRRGLIPHARVMVFCPMEVETVGATMPYEETDIAAAIEWLRSLGNGANVSPEALSATPAPTMSHKRLVITRLELPEAALLSRTSEDLFAEPDLDLWLRDSLEPDGPEVGIVGRRLPSDPAAARELLAVTPPQPHELYPAPISRTRSLLTSHDAADNAIQAFIFRAGELLDSDGINAAQAAIRPGDVLVLPDSLIAAYRGVLVGGDLTAQSSKLALGDVLEKVPDTSTTAQYKVYLQDGSDGLLALLPAAMRQARDYTPSDRDLTVDEVGANLPPDASSLWFSLFEKQNDETKNTSSTWVVPVSSDADDSFPWLVVVTDSSNSLPQELLQEQSPGGNRVLLADHQQDVSERGGTLGNRLHLPDELTMALRLAGAHHDDGKAATEWQLRINNRPDHPPLAKQPKAARASRTRPQHTGLPGGWRHEQLSVALAWNIIPEQHRFLASRLIGTSHGHGRMAFPHGSSDLVRQDQSGAMAAACELFNRGTWDELVAHTDRIWGVWGIAYLEALLRAADIQVSKEGH
ncbi:MAG: type I-U CRISPR-associated helicase/endonuclease Cas3 [Propioniciclava sp.]|uniref:type I-G CRISPR-associated helicase/endonuclease Cas3g n=1 Tax=Propioniciclava sp. TaxID=2038686 RepID=UPI0039E6C022